MNCNCISEIEKKVDEKVIKEKDKTPSKNRTKKNVSIQVSYCPFCGKEA